MGLTNFNNKEYPSGKKTEHIFEQYKIYVESAEKVSDRRSNLNTFYLSLTTTVAGIIGYLKSNKIENSEYLIVGLSISAILICIYWISLLENYRKLNSGKELNDRDRRRLDKFEDARAPADVAQEQVQFDESLLGY